MIERARLDCQHFQHVVLSGVPNHAGCRVESGLGQLDKVMAVELGDTSFHQSNKSNGSDDRNGQTRVSDQARANQCCTHSIAKIRRMRGYRLGGLLCP
jgi:hypothetical protein